MSYGWIQRHSFDLFDRPQSRDDRNQYLISVSSDRHFSFRFSSCPNSLRPTTPPSQITLSSKSGGSITIELHGNQNPETITQIIGIIQKYLTNAPGRDILAVCESLLANNAVLFKANLELVSNAKSNEKLNIEARYLRKETSQQLQAEASTKEDAKEDAAIARETKKADRAMKKAQDLAERTERRRQAILTKELRSEWERLDRINCKYFS